MTIKLQDMLKKAENKGYSTNKSNKPSKKELSKPWQQDSVLFNKEEVTQETNGGKTIHETIHETIHKPYTKYTQSIHTNKNYTRSIHRNNDKLYTNIYTKQAQKKEPGNKKNHTKLKGLQKTILYFIYENCKQNRSLTSEPISKEEMSNSLNINYLSIHNTIQRLVGKGLLIRKEPIFGRNGSTIYELSDFIYKYLSHKEIEASKHNKLYTKIYTDDPNSSSYIINKTTTKEGDLPEEWSNINYELIENIGFSVTQLKQLYNTEICDSNVIQDSINHFAFALENNEKIKSHNNPLNLFMGVLRKGHAWIESNYESPRDRALRELLERKKAEKEKREERIRELYNLSFEEWLDGFSEEELADLYKRISPKGSIKYHNKDNPLNRATFSNHFNADIWSEKRKELGLNKLIKNE